MSDVKTFWSKKINPTSLSAPKTILRKHATELGQLTKNIVEANVNTTLQVDDAEGFANSPTYLHCFDILSPGLGFKSFTLFCVQQSLISDFPLRFYSNYWDKKEWCKCDNLMQFNKCLEEILSSEKTAKLINSIIAQSA